MNHTRKNIKLGIFLNVGIGIIFIIAAVVVVITVNYNMRQQALVEAQQKARIILDRNLATHTYFSQIMKPSIFAWSEPFRTKDYFDHTWMSSTFAIREIEKYFKSFNPSGYSFRDAAINARSPENEADEYERAFIEKLNTDNKLESESAVRHINEKPYLVVLRKGEVMEASCLKCHSDPKKAPKGLTDNYGSKRSFYRSEGDTISAVSLRIPLSEAYAAATVFSLKLSIILLIILVCLFTIQYWLYRRYLLKPLNVMREKADQIAKDEGHLGEQIAQPFGRELSELTDTFNEMSVKLRHERDHLEELVNKRTKALQESESLLQATGKIAKIGCWEFDVETQEQVWTEEVYRIHEVDMTYKPTVSQGIEFYTPASRQIIEQAVQHTIEYGEPFDVELEFITAKGNHLWVHAIGEASQKDGKTIKVAGTFQEITDRKRAEEKIKASLLEKETMLKEIHHRVKNNLQVISSLLDLQSSYLQDEKAKEMLHNSMDRISTMAKIHTMLYQSKDMSRVNFGGFIGDLAGRLQQSYGIAASPIQVHADIADISLTIETSIPCGLILNELVSNALKHAFLEEKGGEVNISMTTTGDQFILTVSDNGIGFPEAIDFQNTKSLGLELVNLLVGQINGTITMTVKEGTTFTITFPAVRNGG